MKQFETQAIRTQAERSRYREHSVPIYPTSSFTFESAEQMRDTFKGELQGQIYSRYSNPNTDELIEKMCLLEGTEAGFVTASGMSAIFNSILPFLQVGDHVIASRAVFGSTHQILTKLLPKWGMSHTYVDPADLDSWEQYIQPNTKMLILETPSNPGLALIDLEKAGKIAKKHNLIFHVDNCFATPYLQNPARFGADLVIHSATKYIDGQGRVLGGVILGKKELLEEIRFFIRHTGPALSPFNAWILSKSLETLAIRMERHCESALALAKCLETRSDVVKVLYPGLPSHPNFEIAKKQMRYGGGLVSFEVQGGVERSQRLLNAIKMLSLSSNLGDSRTIITHPASTTHSKLSEEERQTVGISQGLIRISVGLEHQGDIIADIRQALDNSSNYSDVR